ncbi:MAG: hypothetical protein WD672_00045 [Woeseia sp.]
MPCRNNYLEDVPVLIKGIAGRLRSSKRTLSMRALFPILVIALLPGCAASPASPHTFQQVLDQHAAAHGGRAAIEGVERLQIDLAIDEPPFVLAARYSASRDGRMRIDVYSDDIRVFSEGFNGRNGWQWPGGTEQPVAMSVAGEAAIKRGIVGNLYGLHERPALGYDLHYNGTEDAGETRFHVIESTSPDGFVERFYIDADTGRLAQKREISSLHPDTDPVEQAYVTHFGDYRVVDGRWFSFRSEKRPPGSDVAVQTVILTSVIINPDLPDELFLPEVNFTEPE